MPDLLSRPTQTPPDVIHLAEAQYVTVTPILAEIPSQNSQATNPEPVATVALLDPPTATPLPPAKILEPSPTATQVIVVEPTATPAPTETPVPAPTATSLPTATPIPAQPEISHVVIISIDGLRPDAWDTANTPNLDNLRARGAYSPRAKSVLPSETMPNHASMLGGMSPDKHGILWNILYDEAPRITGPTLFTVAHDAGLSTAMVAGKLKLEYLVLPGSVDTVLVDDVTDNEVKDKAVGVIQAGLPNVFFVHFPGVDKKGHDTSWMSPEQLQVVQMVDGFVGEIAATLEQGGYLPNTLLIVTADHGGSGGTHNTDTPENTTVPWLAVGPGVQPGLTLNSNIMMYDTAATALFALKLPIPDIWDGRPVTEIFASTPGQ
jgi:hypothetical protein